MMAPGSLHFPPLIVVACLAVGVCPRSEAASEGPRRPLHLADLLAAWRGELATPVEVGRVMRPSFPDARHELVDTLVVAIPAADPEDAREELWVECPDRFAGRPVLVGLPGSGRVEVRGCTPDDVIRLRAPASGRGRNSAKAKIEGAETETPLLDLPAGGVLRTSIGEHRDVSRCRASDAITFRVVARSGAGATTTVLERRLQPGARLEDAA